jgi:hypothetical protein
MRFESVGFDVKSEISLARLRVGPMASVAVFRENRTNVLVETDRLGSRVGCEEQNYGDAGYGSNEEGVVSTIHRCM